MKEPPIIALIGPSGAGKTTITAALHERYGVEAGSQQACKIQQSRLEGRFVDCTPLNCTGNIRIEVPTPNGMKTRVEIFDPPGQLIETPGEDEQFQSMKERLAAVIIVASVTSPPQRVSELVDWACLRLAGDEPRIPSLLLLTQGDRMQWLQRTRQRKAEPWAVRNGFYNAVKLLESRFCPCEVEFCSAVGWSPNGAPNLRTNVVVNPLLNEGDVLPKDRRYLRAKPVGSGDYTQYWKRRELPVFSDPQRFRQPSASEMERLRKLSITVETKPGRRDMDSSSAPSIQTFNVIEPITQLINQALVLRTHAVADAASKPLVTSEEQVPPAQKRLSDGPALGRPKPWYQFIQATQLYEDLRTLFRG